MKVALFGRTDFSGGRAFQMLCTPFICFIISSHIIMAQSPLSPVTDSREISTSVGRIMVHIREVPQTTPLIFLHGVYYDHALWNYQTSRIMDRTVITVDMPFHGQSRQSSASWDMQDCSQMLIDILDSLQVPKAVAIGHSWGSMTILRAAHKHPDRFQAIGLCNMPFEAGTPGSRWKFRMQHTLLSFRSFYTKQVAKAMYGKQTLASNPELAVHLDRSMRLLSTKQIRQTDQRVIMQVEDASDKISQLVVPALALKGREDYVPQSSALPYTLVAGGHVSPLEAPEEVFEFVQKVLNLK